MSDELLFCLWVLVTVFCCAAWLGWWAGRRHEKSVQALRRMRKRRPYAINVDFEFCASAFEHCGYKVERVQKGLH